MRLTSILLIVVMALSFAVVTAQDKPDFSGTWIMNADKSDLGDMGGRGGRMGGRMGGGSSKMVVEIEGKKMSVETFRNDRDGNEVSTVLKYTLDGKECTNESRRGESISTANWSKDGKLLTIYTETYMAMGDREFTIESEAVWSLEEGTLKIKNITSTPRGERESTRVYDKEVKK